MPLDGLDGEKTIDAVEFKAAVLKVLNDPAYRRSVQRVAESMKGYGGANAAADKVERFAAGFRK